MATISDRILADLFEKFDQLRRDLADYGAEDSEPNRVFAAIVRKALANEEIEWKKLNWELYSNTGHVNAQRRLTNAARSIYKRILEYGRIRDIAAIKAKAGV